MLLCRAAAVAAMWTELANALRARLPRGQRSLPSRDRLQCKGGGVCLVWISACAKGGDPRPVCPYLTVATGYLPWLSGLTAVHTADDPRTPLRR